MIPYGRQEISESDIAAIEAAVRQPLLTQGPLVEEFEHRIAGLVGARHAVAFSSGTAALHGATAATGLGRDDVVATSALSFVASANCATYVGAAVRFVDIDPATLNIDLSAVPPSTDGLVAVHYAGLPVAWDELERRPRVIIEDAAHAFGASTPDGPVGNCAQSDACVFSFHPVKSITTAEGGMVTTNSDDIANRLRRFRNSGLDRTGAGAPWEYTISELGYNYRLSEVHAALGIGQLSRLDEFIALRNQRADRYDELLAPLARSGRILLPPHGAAGQVHARHLYPVQVSHRSSVYAALRQRGIGVQVHYVPIHHHPLYAGVDPLPHTDAAYAGLLSLPLYPSLNDNDQDAVIDALTELL